MRAAGLFTAIAISVCAHAATSSAQTASPADLGFIHFFKCPSDRDTTRVGDTVTPDACLRVCQSHPGAVGCWWLDGTGGFPRECRICRTLEPTKNQFHNDWAMPIDSVVAERKEAVLF